MKTKRLREWYNYVQIVSAISSIRKQKLKVALGIRKCTLKLKREGLRAVLCNKGPTKNPYTFQVPAFTVGMLDL